ncbi:alpha/beta hydrolase [Micrococcus lylae]|uniref:alpha/beta hydrolase n=1 Tax=Micrococcus lylae TaxID=1273 RepID=UPI0021A41621|nr:alpha/beta hydrolase [Micrococcus lylae]MCT2007923.1 alpha/beta hydrolase [Micrococcus lylae]MCT2071773.1 alpha/beta hydrolase [Micrococcus lylae]
MPARRSPRRTLERLVTLDDGTRLRLRTHLPPGWAEGTTTAASPASRPTGAGGSPAGAGAAPKVADAATGGAEASAVVVMVHGTLVTDAAYAATARALAKRLRAPVATYARRGRSGSSPQPEQDLLAAEVADLRAVMALTRARSVLGHSFGGSVALLAAAEHAAAGGRPWSVVTWDAALNLDGMLAGLWRPGMAEAVADARWGTAWAHLVRDLGTAGPLSRLPVTVLRGMIGAASFTRPGKGMLRLLPASSAEMRAAVAEPVDAQALARNLADTRVTLVTGGRSPGFFADTARVLTQAAHRAGAPRRTAAMAWRVMPARLHDGPITPEPFMLRALASALR